MKPNIVFIMTDQQRRNSLGLYGCKYAHTPHLDALGAGATVYDHCYCDAPVCTPSRACTLTGKKMAGHKVYNLFDILPREEKLLPWYLRELGYQTALVGKLHVSGIDYEAYARNPGDGFDFYELCHEPSLYLDSPYNGYARWLRERFPQEYEALRREGRARRHRDAQSHFTTWVSRRAAEYIRSREKTRPFFLMAGYFDPHNPYDHCPPESEELLHEEYYEAPVTAPGEMQRCPEAVRLERRYHHPKALGAQDVPDRLHAMRRGYFAGVSFIDRQVQMIFDALREEGIWQDTLIVYTSDHGDMLGDHSLFAKGAALYEDCVNVPLIVKYPGQTAGARRGDMVQLRDLFSTMYQAAGGDASLRPDSLPLPRADDPPGRDFALTEYMGCGKFDLYDYPYPVLAAMVRTSEWKLNLYHDTGEYQLFHLADDPLETRDLSGEQAYRGQAFTLAQRYMRYAAKREYADNNARGGRSKVPGFANLPSQNKLP